MANTTPRDDGTDIAENSDDLDTFNFDDGLDDLEDDNDSLIEDELETDDETDGESADDDLEPDDVEDDDEDDDEAESDEDADKSDDDEAESDEGDKSDDENDNRDDELIELTGGQEVTFGELKNGYLRQQDYTRKQNFYNERVRNVENQGELLQNQATVLAEFIAQNLPQQPSQELALTDPSAHYQQQVAYNNAEAQLKQLLEIAGNVEKVNKGTVGIKSDDQVRREVDSLKSLYPKDFKNEKLKTAFFKTTFDAAVAAGFSEEEARANTDHRLFVLARKAHLFDQMQKKTTSGESDDDGKTVVKSKRRRRFVPPKKNTAARNKVGASTRRQKARLRLEREDSVENATALLSSQ